MPKVKIARKSTAIDMTAMCDVAFLLLTFFILTATARQPEPLPVDTPASTVTTPQPDKDIGTVTIGKGKVFFGVKEPAIRRSMLEKMSGIYHIPFTEDEKKRFSLMESFGVDMNNLKTIINLDNTQRNKEGFQPGIPTDSVGDTRSQLAEWIYQARYATKEINNADMRLSIKGDAPEEYPAIQKVIKIVQAQNLNKFSLITSLRAAEKK
ncbi:ExbD/TolR family protein [Hufsiella ginkgonis]|uniref:Biopolymer transporter ExbD n=1 Tax=Hufsiella ginkgonis TaxID=2695274 RepID=A0A7K1Y2T0_9SPHI|nr:biopolymer transporter ExbD [Hufsiella ginkgonis]MXV17532.1 biopolymer transporter ExbD [Hufsiella ginkgonis]